MKKLIEWWKNLFTEQEEVSIKKNAALTKSDRHYLEFLIAKKKKVLKKKGKRFTPSHRKELITKVKDQKYNHLNQTNKNDSGWGFIEYYLLFHWMNSNNNSDYYYSDDYINSSDFQSAPDNTDSYQGNDGEFGGGGASSSWENDNSDSSDNDNSSSDDSSYDDSSDYSSNDSSSYDSGSSDSGSGGDF